MIARRDIYIYSAAITLSVVAHVTLLKGLGDAARHAPRERARPIEVAVIAPAPKAPPPPPQEAPKPKPTPKAPPKVVKAPPPPPSNSTPPPSSEPQKPVRPVFGISMASTVGAGSMAMPVGNTVMQQPDKDPRPKDVQPYKSVAAYQVTRMPKRVGECIASYPREAKQLHIEGKVTLQVEVLSTGKVGEVHVLTGIGHGLDEAAVNALAHCTFEPAQLAGETVATTIQYVYTFLLED